MSASAVPQMSIEEFDGALPGQLRGVCVIDVYKRQKESLLRLEGWSRQRRVIILRRRVKGDLAISSNETSGQQTLSFVDVGAGVDVYEYSVLATSLDEELVSFGQLYRDRGDSENIFDELKNQWGWGGFVTQDLARCRLAARMIALFYDLSLIHI